ncbi:C-C motif chemokine 3-like [Petaurus breviceps papuanus]|uniref:C-C motif chemokine 3-like n=1 Tax=Petaurus breviceps papuanus TaxID=3040969 RepID=UPI0036DDB920
MVSLVVLSILTILVPGLCFEDKKYERYDIPNACCFQYSPPKIPNVVGCYVTSSRCPKPGVIVITSDGRQHCIRRRKDEWNCNIFLPETTFQMREYAPQTPPYAD